MSVQIQALIEALRGADPAVVKQLRDAVAALPEEAAPVNPCDFGHEWSDDRKNAMGRRVNRSCKRCGVLAMHTGAHHGQLAPEETDVGAAAINVLAQTDQGAAAVLTDAMLENPAPKAVSKSKAKKSA